MGPRLDLKTGLKTPRFFKKNKKLNLGAFPALQLAPRYKCKSLHLLLGPLRIRKGSKVASTNSFRPTFSFGSKSDQRLQRFFWGHYARVRGSNTG